MDNPSEAKLAFLVGVSKNRREVLRMQYTLLKNFIAFRSNVSQEYYRWPDYLYWDALRAPQKGVVLSKNGLLDDPHSRKPASLAGQALNAAKLFV